LKILVLDDEADYRYIVRRFLERADHEVIEAQNGKDGLAALQSDRPDLIISDIRMPMMSGDEFFQQVRSAENDLNIIPFIFLSGHVDDDAVIQRLNDGAHHCLRKPVSGKMLLAHVNSCLSASQRYSEFVSEKLEIISQALPASIRHDFKPYASLADNIESYFTVIADFIKTNAQGDDGDGVEDIVEGRDLREEEKALADGHSGSGRLTRIRYIRFYLEESNRRQGLVVNSGTEALTWQLIFLVAESQISGRAIYVSDLYFLAQAAKSTINNRITSLVDDSVFAKHSSLQDGRRQSVAMTETFAAAFYKHIDEAIRKITEVTSQPKH